MSVERAVLRMALAAFTLGCGGRIDILTDKGSVTLDAGTVVNVDANADAIVGVVVCGVPAGGGCALCNGLYYCPEWPPSPPCPQGLQQGQCTTTCIACPNDGVQELDPMPGTQS